MTTKRKRNPEGLSHEAWELVLWAENSARLQNQYDSIVKNIVRRIRKGTYDPDKAPRLWQYWFESAAKDYTKEFGTGRGYGIFTPAIRREAAAYYAPIMYQDIKAGEATVQSLGTIKRGKNPVAKRKRKRKATPAQLRALAKGRRVMAAKRKTKKKRRRNPAYGNYSVARGVVRQGWPKKKRTPTRTANPANQYGIRVGSNYFDGAGMTSKKENAARWRKLNPCKRVAQKLADATGKDVAIVGM